MPPDVIEISGYHLGAPVGLFGLGEDPPSPAPTPEEQGPWRIAEPMTAAEPIVLGQIVCTVAPPPEVLICGYVDARGYKCAKTAESFGTLSSFNRHRKGHRRRHRCGVCSRAFTQKTHRDRHQARHT